MLWHPPPANDVNMVLSVPVAFQYPEAAALFGLAPFGYLRSLGLKKYHSFSPNAALADKEGRTQTRAVLGPCMLYIYSTSLAIYIYIYVRIITLQATYGI